MEHRFHACLPLTAFRRDLNPSPATPRQTHPLLDQGVGGGGSESSRTEILDTKAPTFATRESLERAHRVQSPPGHQSLKHHTGPPPPKRPRVQPKPGEPLSDTDTDDTECEEGPPQPETEGTPGAPTTNKQGRFPTRLPYSRGSSAGLSEVSGAEACEELQELKWSASGGHSRRAREGWWGKIAAERGIQAYPLTTDSLRLAAGLLRKGGYRSAELYLGTFKNMHIRLGHPWNEQLVLELQECTRAVRRGIGPARQADALPLDAIGGIEGQDEAKDIAIVASWWMLREIELSAATVNQLTFEDPVEGDADKCGRAIFNLPVSKSDHKALGKLRTHNCACPSRLCPVAAAQRLRERAIASALRHQQAVFTAPLVPTDKGEHQTKKQIVSLFLSLTDAVGANDLRITGHSPRVTGAQRMALAGISEWRIQTFGRWGSSAVLGYIRETLLQGKSDFLAAEVEAATPAPLSGSLEEIVSMAVPALPLSTLTPDYLLDRVDRALENIAGGHAISERWEGQLKNKLLEQVRAVLLPVQQECDELRNPKAVRNNLSGVVHLIRTSTHTMCGWMWADHVGTSTPVKLDAEGFWCKRCCRVGDQLGGNE